MFACGVLRIRRSVEGVTRSVASSLPPGWLPARRLYGRRAPLTVRNLLSPSDPTARVSVIAPEVVRPWSGFQGPQRFGRQPGRDLVAHGEPDVRGQGGPQARPGGLQAVVDLRPEVGRRDDAGGKGVLAVSEAHGLGPDGEGDGARRGRARQPKVPQRGADGAVLGAALYKVGGAEEAGDLAGGGAVVEGLRLVVHLEAAVGNEGYAVGENDGLLLVVGDEDGGVAALALEAQDEVPHLFPEVGVERAEGLVEEQEPRVGDEGAGERYPLLLAARELLRRAVGETLHPHAPQGLVDPAPGLPLGGAAHLEADPDVPGDAHVGEEERLLEDHRRLAPP